MNNDLKKHFEHAFGILEREQKRNDPKKQDEVDRFCDFLEGGIREYIANMQKDHIAKLFSASDNNEEILESCCKQTKEKGTQEEKLAEFLLHQAVRRMK